jgi:ferredoxin
MNAAHLYFFSGTGNARFVAHTFRSVSHEKNVPCELTDLGITDRKNIQPPAPDELIGFISPTHGFNYPPLVVNFLLRFPRGRNRVFLMNTRAGMKLWKWFLPGLSGIALLMAALILMFKGYRIVGMRSIDLPSNWISLHPGVRPKVALSIYRRCKKRTEVFAEKILAGKKVYRALLDLPFDLAIAPISLGYYFIGRFTLAKSFIANKDCNNCLICINGCPVQAISLVNNRPYWSFSCESCMKCMNYCPKRAIETAHGFYFGILYLGNLAQTIWFWGSIERIIGPLPDNLWWNALEFTINCAVALIFFYLGYRLIHYLSGNKYFARLVQYTSLTTWRFWRRYKGYPPTMKNSAA